MKSVFAIACIVIACGSSAPPSDAGTDATKDVSTDTGIDCSKIGCAMPPPCGQPCKEVCGCCGCATGAICSVCDAAASD